MFNRCGFLLGAVLILLSHSAQASRPLAVDSVRVVKTPVLRHLDAQVEAVQQATLSAQVSGRIIDIRVDVDDYVEKGGILMRFRDKELRAAFNAAKASFEQARLAHQRNRDIYQKKLIAKSVLDKSEAVLKGAKARLEQAEEALQNTIVRAPYNGIVVKRYVEVGEIARVGSRLMTGLSLEKLRATVQIPQNIIHAVRQRKQAWIYVGKLKNKRVLATSITISPYADPVTHTFEVQLYLPEGAYDIYPGMFTKVSFVIAQKESLVIPKKAVAYRSEVTAVYVQTKDGDLSFRQIRLGHAINATQLEVLAGLSQDEIIALDPVRAAVLIKYQHLIKVNKEAH